MGDHTFDRVSEGVTYEVHTQDHVFYITINDEISPPFVLKELKKQPFELFVQPDEAEHLELITVITRLSSMAIREGVNPLVVAQELQDIHSPITRHFIPGTNREAPSITARIGRVLQGHIKRLQC